LNFILTAARAAVHSVGETELEELFRSAKRYPGRMLELSGHSLRLDHAVWLFSILSCTLAGAELLLLMPHGSLWIMAPAALVLLYLLGSAVPDLLGRKRAGLWLLRWERVVLMAVGITSPVTYVLNVLSGCMIRLFGIDPSDLENEVTEDEIISMVNEGHEQGVLDASEAEMIQNIFELDDKKASDIMTHRKNLIAISGMVNLREALDFMVQESVSRFPVYEDTIDNILGILHLRDAMKFHTMGQYEDWLVKDIPELLHPVRFIPETRGIHLLFQSMQAQKLQMVIVVDEYGQTAGLVTMEDILEEIVGNIQDEYDTDEQFIHQGPGGSYVMDGMTPLEEAGEVLGITFDEEYDTLNGFLISRLDRIPSEGEQPSVCESGYLFRILQVENKIVSRVQITRTEEKKKENEKE
jgi:putative hemolysin